MRDLADQIETPSGKGAAEENFPVASRLLAARHRPVVMAYYAFARAADDIADSPDLKPEEKVARLDRLEAGLRGRDEGEGVAKAERLGALLRERGIALERAADLLKAFRQDATRKRYQTWDELRAYCRRSAEPVGRFLLDLHGEDPALYPASDALCSALQVLNHLQDLADDYRDLDRVYLPLEFLEEAGVEVSALAAPSCTPALHQAIDDCLWRSESLLARADGLVAGLADRRLLTQATATLSLAKRLQRRLERGDPLARRIKLSRWDFLMAGGAGLLRGGIGA